MQPSALTSAALEEQQRQLQAQELEKGEGSSKTGELPVQNPTFIFWEFDRDKETSGSEAAPVGSASTRDAKLGLEAEAAKGPTVPMLKLTHAWDAAEPALPVPEQDLSGSTLYVPLKTEEIGWEEGGIYWQKRFQYPIVNIYGGKDDKVVGRYRGGPKGYAFTEIWEMPQSHPGAGGLLGDPAPIEPEDIPRTPVAIVEPLPGKTSPVDTPILQVTDLPDDETLVNLSPPNEPEDDEEQMHDARPYVPLLTFSDGQDEGESSDAPSSPSHLSLSLVGPSFSPSSLDCSTPLTEASSALATPSSSSSLFWSNSDVSGFPTDIASAFNLMVAATASGKEKLEDADNYSCGGEDTESSCSMTSSLPSSAAESALFLPSLRTVRSAYRFIKSAGASSAGIFVGASCEPSDDDKSAGSTMEKGATSATANIVAMKAAVTHADGEEEDACTSSITTPDHAEEEAQLAAAAATVTSAAIIETALRTKAIVQAQAQAKAASQQTSHGDKQVPTCVSNLKPRLSISEAVDSRVEAVIAALQQLNQEEQEQAEQADDEAALSICAGMQCSCPQHGATAAEPARRGRPYRHRANPQEKEAWRQQQQKRHQQQQRSSSTSTRYSWSDEYCASTMFFDEARMKNAEWDWERACWA